ncbi:MAG: Uma2 family endonuclease [Anaerolineae bacterium]
MAVQLPRLYTVEEFERFVDLPENEDFTFEFIGGEIVEVTSNPYSSQVSMRTGRLIGNFVDEHQLGYVTGEAGGYVVFGERYAPDVGFVSKARQRRLAQRGYNPIPPDLAVEVFSPSDTEKKLRIKIANYIAAGTVVWVIYPMTQEVEIYVPGKPVEFVDKNGVINGGDVLPGFTLSVAKIFEGLYDE